MRRIIINFLKRHPIVLGFFWTVLKIVLQLVGIFVKQEKIILFSSFGGRQFADSPKAIYYEICKRKEFDDWQLVWAFEDVTKFSIPRGEMVKIDTIPFFVYFLRSKIWVSNSGISRGISLKRSKTISVETWHGTPIKKIGGEENSNSIGGKRKVQKEIDHNTIRCAQSEYDLNILKRIFNADEKAFIMCDLPRNDELFRYDDSDIRTIKKSLNIPLDKEVILYTPTYREFRVDRKGKVYDKLEINIDLWEESMSDKYVLLIRAHYAVDIPVKIGNSSFIYNVSDYPNINDLYIISDIMISDYSSTFIDYSILDRPMYCYAYDLEEYTKKRGLYVDLHNFLPCSIDRTEKEVLDHILHDNKEKHVIDTIKFHEKYAGHAGNASSRVVDEILGMLKGTI